MNKKVKNGLLGVCVLSSVGGSFGSLAPVFAESSTNYSNVTDIDFSKMPIEDRGKVLKSIIKEKSSAEIDNEASFNNVDVASEGKLTASVVKASESESAVYKKVEDNYQYLVKNGTINSLLFESDGAIFQPPVFKDGAIFNYVLVQGDGKVSESKIVDYLSKLNSSKFIGDNPVVVIFIGDFKLPDNMKSPYAMKLGYLFNNNFKNGYILWTTNKYPIFNYDNLSDEQLKYVFAGTPYQLTSKDTIDKMITFVKEQKALSEKGDKNAYTSDECTQFLTSTLFYSSYPIMNSDITRNFLSNIFFAKNNYVEDNNIYENLNDARSYDDIINWLNSYKDKLGDKSDNFTLGNKFAPQLGLDIYFNNVINKLPYNGITAGNLLYYYTLPYVKTSLTKDERDKVNTLYSELLKVDPNGPAFFSDISSGRPDYNYNLKFGPYNVSSSFLDILFSLSKAHPTWVSDPISYNKALDYYYNYYKIFDKDFSVKDLAKFNFDNMWAIYRMSAPNPSLGNLDSKISDIVAFNNHIKDVYSMFLNLTDEDYLKAHPYNKEHRDLWFKGRFYNTLNKYLNPTDVSFIEDTIKKVYKKEPDYSLYPQFTSKEEVTRYFNYMKGLSDKYNSFYKPDGYLFNRADKSYQFLRDSLDKEVKDKNINTNNLAYLFGLTRVFTPYNGSYKIEGDTSFTDINFLPFVFSSDMTVVAEELLYDMGYDNYKYRTFDAYGSTDNSSLLFFNLSPTNYDFNTYFKQSSRTRLDGHSVLPRFSNYYGKLLAYENESEPPIYNYEYLVPDKTKVDENLTIYRSVFGDLDNNFIKNITNKNIKYADIIGSPITDVSSLKDYNDEANTTFKDKFIRVRDSQINVLLNDDNTFTIPDIIGIDGKKVDLHPLLGDKVVHVKGNTYRLVDDSVLLPSTATYKGVGYRDKLFNDYYFGDAVSDGASYLNSLPKDKLPINGLTLDANIGGEAYTDLVLHNQKAGGYQVKPTDKSIDVFSFSSDPYDINKKNLEAFKARKPSILLFHDEGAAPLDFNGKITLQKINKPKAIHIEKGQELTDEVIKDSIHNGDLDVVLDYSKPKTYKGEIVVTCKYPSLNDSIKVKVPFVDDNYKPEDKNIIAKIVDKILGKSEEETPKANKIDTTGFKTGEDKKESKPVAKPISQPKIEDKGIKESHKMVGKDRYDTNVKTIVDKYKPLVIANGREFADSLSAINLVNKFNCNLLLIDNKELNDKQKDIIKKAKNVYVIGGEHTISPKIFDEIKSMSTIAERVGGVDRYDTNNLTLSKTGYKDVIVASGRLFPDSLGGAPLMVDYNLGLKLVRDTAKDAYRNVKFTLGGLVKDPKGIVLAGADRYETNKAINDYLTREGKNLHTIFAPGDNFADSLTSINVLLTNKDKTLSIRLVDKKAIEVLRVYESDYIVGNIENK